MSFEIIVPIAVALAAIVATVLSVSQDGYHRVPTRRF